MEDIINKRLERQISLVGKEGQEKLSNARIVIVGMGGLGSFLSLQLIYAGIKNIVLIDKDKVEISNLNRQILYNYKDIGKTKVKVAVKKLKSFCDVNVIGYNIDITDNKNKRKLNEILSKADIVADCLDNWEARKILNKLCLELNKPLVHAAVQSYKGQIMFIIPGKTPCLECVFPKVKDKKENIPIIVQTVAFASSLQANEIVKFIVEGKYSKELVRFDLVNYNIEKIKIKKRKNCICSVS